MHPFDFWSLGSGNVHLPQVRVDEVVSAVSRQFGVDRTAIMSASRRAETVRARHEVYRRLKACGASYSEIGRVMRRDHSTVMHGVKKALRR